MRLVVIGVNHKTAPVALRERLAFVGDELTTALQQIDHFTDGSVIVSTCNRTEIYALAPLSLSALNESATSQNKQPDKKIASETAYIQDGHGGYEVLIKATITRLIEWLAHFKGLTIEDVKPYLYIHTTTQALNHWLRVAAGLDSMILGEPQIFGQIKQAVNLAQQVRDMSSEMHWVIEQIFGAAKQVRNDTEVGSQAVSLGFAAAKLVTQIFDKPEHTTLLVVAAGEMNRLVATHIAELGVSRIIICNRSPERAQLLADQLARAGRHIEVYPLSQLAEVLPQADIVSSCSGSMDALIDKNMTRHALKQRRYQPMLMVDLAVPRDIEPAVSRMDDVYLYSIDDLQHVIEGNLEQRRQAAVEAELLVSHLVVEIEHRFQVRQVGSEIHEYRNAAHSRAEQLLAESLVQLRQGNESPEAIMTELTRRLTQTLTHAPSKLMRKAAREGDSEMLALVVTGLNDAYRQRLK
ncbi:glutamyl-tRNA reductase [Psychrobacter sp. I-STPA6b]|uniref:glutamyl-tRNA reductase n=1 Tax=Psychrobacter sp. I-STPA6b TaxID=2585718 RepID=UPI001D0C6CB7|nr:glutamyl-tRNA reductase [Psychrobacter sp. I-STPA6b]